MAGTAVLSVVTTLLVAPAVSAESAAPPSTAGTTVAPDTASAIETARRTGNRVEDLSARTELTQVFANPSGGLTAESAVVPQRVRRADGSWADIDLTLRRSGSDWAPTASSADVRFSGGGTTPAVALNRAGRSMSLSWPGGLPEPTVSGDAATYPEVLSGVDLVLRATRTGFMHVFVMKTPQAAANPRLRELRFEVGGDAHLVSGRDGRLSALAGSEVLASSEPAMMWDSNVVPPAPPAPARTTDTDGGQKPTESSSEAPGDVARTAEVDAEISDGDLVLRPDPEMLTPDGATFPVYIDPAWSTGRSRWAYATDNNSNNTDTTVARVGRDPDSGKLYRSFFDFPLTTIRGKHVESAYVQMKVNHTWSCDDTPSYMFHTSGIASTPRTKWSPTLHSLKASADSHANEGSGCSDSPQPDMTVNFTGPAVTSVLHTHTTSNATNITFGFCACSSTSGSGETTTNRWKKYFPGNAKLVVDYDSIPGKPHSLQVAGVACPTTSTTVVGTITPTFSAIFPDADSNQALTTAYEWVQVPGSGVIDASTPRRTPPAGASVPAGGRSTTSAVTVSAGVTYAFRARATDPAPYSRTSPWSDWCRFTADTTVPPAEVHSVTGSLAPGSTVTFSLRSDTSATKFRYGWSSPPTTEIAATAGSGHMSATVTVTVPRYGRNTFHVSAIDTAGNIGYGSHEFVAPRPTTARAQWALETYPGMSATDALKDTADADGETSLTQGAPTWTPDLRIVRGQTASFNGTSSALATSGPVVSTNGSFSVAAWVRLGSLPTTNDSVVASQAGVNATGFHLGTRLIGSTAHWSFLMKDADLQASATRAAYTSTALTSADVGRWTHLAGVYDKPAGKLRLFVNGVQAAEVDRTVAPWSAGGAFAVGRGWSSGGPGPWFHGHVADVQAYDRVLVGHDFTGQLAADEQSGGFDEPGILDPVKVSNWQFSGTLPCYEETTDPFLCGALETGDFGRRLALNQGVNVGDDSRGGFLSFDTTGVDDPSQTTSEFGRSQDNLATPEAPSWQDGPVLRTDESFTVSVWVRPDFLADDARSAVTQIGTQQSAFYLGQRVFAESGGNAHRWSFTLYGIDDDSLQGKTLSAAMTSATITDDDRLRWTHLVGVHDAARREVRLYVNGRLEASVPYGGGAFTGPFQASGPLILAGGRFTFPSEPTKWVDHWQGDLDDLGAYQGVLTEPAVKALFDSQSPDIVEPSTD
ncbi:LamG-like jellyroll fold domain-containing protein [Micromonospora echinospora]